MALESTTYIDGLVATNPTSSDNVGDGDNHIRLVKSTLLATLPNVAGAITGTHTELNTAVALTQGATDQATANTLLKRDSSGGVRANTFYGNVVGNVSGTVTGGSTSAGSATTAGTATQANKLTTARTIALSGDATGSASFDGSANATIAVQVADDSHNHIISNIDGLQSELTRIEGAVSGSAVQSAGKWTTARTISLTGGVTGSASIDGSANHSIITTVASNSHNHTIANVTGLQSALNAKLGASDNAGSATKLATARNIALTGDVTGTASFDGSSNISLSTNITDDSHNHIISNIDGLQTALDDKFDGSDFTGTAIAQALATITGSGSNIDADKLDGHQGLAYLRIISLYAGANGKVRFSANGVEIQIVWGSVYSPDNTSNTAYSFHYPFNTACWQVFVNHGIWANDSNFNGLGSTAPTATTFYLTNHTRNITARYFAIGT